MKMSSWRFVLVVATAVLLIGYPKPASATTFTVTVGTNGGLVCTPFVNHDSPRRSGTLDVEFERPQHNVRLPADAERHLGFWNS